MTVVLAFVGLVISVALAQPFPSPGAPGPLRLPVPETVPLPGGGQAWTVARPEVPMVHLVVSLRHGSLAAQDPLALEEVARLLDLRGPEGHGWLSRQERASARVAVQVDPWRTRLTLSTVRGAEEEGIALLRDLVELQRVDPGSWHRQRRARRETARSAWLAPALVHLAALSQARYSADHPFLRRARLRDLSGLGPGRLARAWGEAVEARADLVAVGDLTPSLLPAVGALFPGTVEHPPRAKPPPRSGPRVVLVDQPGDPRAQLSVLLPLPPDVRRQEPAIELVLRALVTDFDSRLSRQLREERGLVYALDGVVRSTDDHADLELGTSTEAERSAELLTRVRMTIEELVRRPPADGERLRVQAGLRRDIARLLLSNEALAGHLVERQALDIPAAEVWADTHAALQADDEGLRRATALLDPARTIWVLSGDALLLEPALAEAGLPVDSIQSGWTLLPP